MKRWVYFWLCVLASSALLVGAWLMPVHLRAMDSVVILRAGIDSPSLVDRGLALVRENKPGAAEMLWQAAEREQIPGRAKLRAAIAESYRARPDLVVLGMDPRLKTLLEFARRNNSQQNSGSGQEKNQPSKSSGEPSIHQSAPFTDLLIQFENRKKALQLLYVSPDPAVQELLRCRTLTNTVLFPASTSSAGQAFDTALCICGLLVEAQHLKPGFRNAVFASTSTAVRGENSQPLEQVLMDFMSLGQRFNWGQLVSLCEQVEDPETLHLLAEPIRKVDSHWPLVFAAVQLSGQPKPVGKYLETFPQTGEKDLGSSLQFGAGGLVELLLSRQQLYVSTQDRVAGLDFCWRTPRFALTVKWLSFAAAGFLLAMSMRVVKKPQAPLERPLQVRGLHLAREILFALGFLFVVLLLSEPFLSQDSQKAEVPFRLHLPMVGKAVTAENIGAKHSIMNQLSLLTLFLFFVLQALIYVACLVKLSEIRRQHFPSHVKLMLLENEEHLFDAGLYLGFAGTIISLILVSMGVIKPSLMAAYSSTSFGVIFVSIFKIFHLRGYRRKLLLEAEAAKNLSPAPATGHPLAAPL
ncbi:MAG: hypothetical protein ABIQ35_03115 [Verrucomicrobiota bacterium]